MSPRILIILALAAGAAMAGRADESLSSLQVGIDTYTNVVVTKVTATDIYFTHAGGMANAKIKDLSPELQKHFSFDPTVANAAEQKQADSQAKYHAALLHQPAARGPDTTGGPADASHSGEALWRTDFPGALKQAQSENKRVLLDFTGSDWCGWCMKFHNEVLSTATFAAYASQNLELVKVDFPHHTPLPPDQQSANDALSRQFGVNGFPTFVLLNSGGRELGRQVGYQPGGPDAFIAELEKFGGR